MTEKEEFWAVELILRLIEQTEDKRGGRHVLLCAYLSDYINEIKGL